MIPNLVSVKCLIVVAKISKRCRFKKEGFISAYSSKEHSTPWPGRYGGYSRRFYCILGEQRRVSVCNQLALPPILRAGLTTSINLVYIITCSHAQRFVSMVILTFIKLTIKKKSNTQTHTQFIKGSKPSTERLHIQL